jgi:glutaminase
VNELDFDSLLADIARAVRPVSTQGKVADYIPTLRDVDPHLFGIALATVDGDLFAHGDAGVRFSVQSVAKVFALALVLARDAEHPARDASGLWRRVGREPSGNPFNSLVQLEYERGIPRNPFINAGALVVVDHLLATTGDAFRAVRDFVRAESGIADIDLDPAVARSEVAHGDRNAALAHFMASYDNLLSPVEQVLDHYFRQCSLSMSCAELARTGLFLARHGVRADGTSLFSRSEAKRINAIMLTCGTYDAAGEFAYRVGLPAKSGVGGGILAIIPGRGALCVWGPALDKSGNSVAGVEALDRFTTITGWSVF